MNHFCFTCGEPNFHRKTVTCKYIPSLIVDTISNLRSAKSPPFLGIISKRQGLLYPVFVNWAGGKDWAVLCQHEQ